MKLLLFINTGKVNNYLSSFSYFKQRLSFFTFKNKINYMYKLISFATLFFICAQLTAQYKNDNVLYKTVYPEDLGQQLKASPGYLLLDVRSKGENEDTSSSGLNIGRFKNAKNIDIRQLANRLNELQGFKSSPIFVYCSHSQRSRRASKMLADSGFTNVYNINGGMTTLLQANSNLNDIYETKNNYHLLSPTQFCKEISSLNVYLLDVRPDSLYNFTTGSEFANAMGKLKTAVHIPYSDLESSLSQIPNNKKIIIADAFGDLSYKAAALLTSKGYKNVAVLFDGIYNLTIANMSDAGCKTGIWQPNKKYHILTADEFDALAKKDKDVAILDIRTAAEYNNQSKDAWRNVGHIKNAINVPAADLQNRIGDLSSFKNKPVIVYAFSAADGYAAAAKLVDLGFTHVNILAGGIFNLRWRAANIKGKTALKDWVVDVPAENM